MDNKYHRYIYYLGATILFLLLHFGLLFVSDPLKIFHKPWYRDDYFVREMRTQAAGIINQEEFDSIILATSMGANFSAKEASYLWGDDFVNISVDGSMLEERTIILEYALRKKKLENVIISLDGFGDSDYVEENTSITSTLYGYLYDEYRYNDLFIFNNRKYLPLVLCGYNDYYSGKFCPQYFDLHTLTWWESDRYGVEKWLQNAHRAQTKNALNYIEAEMLLLINDEVSPLDITEFNNTAHQDYIKFKNYIEKFAAASPETMFYLFFPPYSSMINALRKKTQLNEHAAYLERIRKLTEISERYENIKVYGFDDMDFTEDLFNYKDPEHYHPKINSDILNWMIKDTNLLSTANVENYISKFTAKSQNYPIEEFGTRIVCFLGNVDLSELNCGS